jgi:hypothetical protein
MVEIITDPGYITEFTDRGAKGRYIDGENVRFRKGLPEKIGGSQLLSTSTFLGTTRRMMNFKSLDLDKYIAFGTNKRFYIYDGGSIINVTPVRTSGTLSNPFTTTAASNIIEVADVAHGQAEGDIVTFSLATASPIDGILVDGDYEVIEVIDADTYTIQHATTATNSEASFGDASVSYSYEIHAGLESSLVGTGWGSLTWGYGTWGTPRTGSDINLPLRTLSIEKWGEDVMWNIRGGAIYIFDTSGGIITSNRAVEITQSPDTVEWIIVSPEDRTLIALGAHDGSNSNPMLVAWCSQEDYTDWIPSAINTAGDKLLDVGTRIMTGVYARNQIAILTDSAFYSMIFIGYPEVFSISIKASECGAISPNCAVAYGDYVIWMGENTFWLYDGSVQEIPCDIRNYVFGNLNRTQKDKIYASINSNFHEVWWLCPHNDGGYFIVIYNKSLQCFYYTTMNNWGTARSAMVDKGAYSENPIAAGLDNRLWTQEIGVDHGSDALPSRLVRFYDEIGDGDDTTFSTKVIPDFSRLTGSLLFTMKGMKYPQPNIDSGAEPDTVKGPYTFTNQTRKKNIRMRARQISWEIETQNLGDDWRFGTKRIDVAPTGKRG